VIGINEINRVEKGDVCFVDHEKYVDKTLNSEASFVLMPFKQFSAEDKVVLITERPFEIYNQMAKDFHDEISSAFSEPKIHPTAKVHPAASIGKGVVIGENSIIEAMVTIHDGVKIGDRVKIESGSVIGSEAFYYHKSKKGKYTKWYSCGGVQIENDVDIAALCTINKGVSSITSIGEGTKIDCHVHIGHGVKIGKHCLITAQVGISGKTKIGNHVKIYGQVGITQNLNIGNHVSILAQSGVGDDIPEGQTVFGSPAGPAREKMRELFALKQLVKRRKNK
jgi:UDP-3-O-[3-hydroxymyristoyl] glucosamine N-acyltransferase